MTMHRTPDFLRRHRPDAALKEFASKSIADSLGGMGVKPCFYPQKMPKTVSWIPLDSSRVQSRATLLDKAL